MVLALGPRRVEMVVGEIGIVAAGDGTAKPDLGAELAPNGFRRCSIHSCVSGAA
jgi:hypothetical protein